MKSTTIMIVSLVVIVVLGGVYWFLHVPVIPMVAGTPISGAAGTNGSPNQGNLGQPATSTPQTPQGDGTTVGQNLILGVNASATLGKYLSAFNGMTLYTYAPDTANVSNCTGSCAANWPPYTVPSASAINVPANITGHVGTITRADGSIQVTYNSAPLYFYIKDTKPNDTNGQGVGGVWYVVKP